jgi:hypothetical protein
MKTSNKLLAGMFALMFVLITVLMITFKMLIG